MRAGRLKATATALPPGRGVHCARAVTISISPTASDFVRASARSMPRREPRGVFVLSGASSFPALTAAVVRRLASGLHRVTRSAPASRRPPYRGRRRECHSRDRRATRVSPAAASRWCGGPVPGLTDHWRLTIAPPGRLPLDNRPFSLVDVPDLPRARPRSGPTSRASGWARRRCPRFCIAH